MKQLLKSKDCGITELKKRLNDQTIEINKKYQEQFNDKQERVDAIIKIALAECKSVYNEIDSLIRGSERFSLENLMNYTPQLRKLNFINLLESHFELIGQNVRRKYREFNQKNKSESLIILQEVRCLLMKMKLLILVL